MRFFQGERAADKADVLVVKEAVCFVRWDVRGKRLLGAAREVDSAEHNDSSVFGLEESAFCGE